jgi:ATP-dependent DNA helicase RecG
VGFEALIDFVHSAAPQNKSIEQVIREEVKMFPKQALRELIANALVHQDFSISGASVMIEMYDDRVEISNAGIPPIKPERFIDEYRSRNEQLADLMRRLNICEEKGSGIDKVVNAAEVYQLPAPDFRVGECRTTAVLFSHQNFSAMSKADRIRACYQHCCLMYVSNQRMSNQTLRKRFGFESDESKSATVSQVIKETKDNGFIKADESETSSTRYARYLPFWA